MKNKLFNVLIMVVMLSTIVTTIGTQPTQADEPDLNLVPETNIVQIAPTGTVYGEIKGATEPAMYIIQFDDPPLATYRGGLPGLAPTNPAARGATRLDVHSPTSVAYIHYLTTKQAQVISAIEETLGHDIEVTFQYKYAYNGIAARMTPAEAAIVAGMDGVSRVERDFVRYPDTSDTPEFIGAPGIWDGTNTGGLPGTMGEDIVVGIIDTGINMDHPSFANPGPADGFVYTNPYTGYLGLCATYPMSYTCNDKLVGAYDFVDGPNENDGPEDGNGHGSHTASTVAGNFVTATMVFSTTSMTLTISGVAPHANIIAYDACAPGGCPGSSLVAAIDQATADGVDVINYSIGGGPTDPWGDADSLAFLNSRDAGVFVAVSAGNDGPGAETIGSPANSPWVTSVGATTHNRKYLNALVNMRNASTLAPQPASASAINARTAPQQLGRSAPSHLAPNATLIDEEFNAVPPAGWTAVISNTNYPTTTWYLEGTGDTYASVQWDPIVDPQDEWLVSDYFTLTEAYLDFWSFGSLYWCRDTYDNCDLEVWLIVGPGVNDGDDIYVGKADGDWPASWTWAETYIDLTSLLPGGQVRLGFRYNALDGAQAGLDAVLLMDQYPPPADIYGESITSGYGPAPIVYAGDYPNPNDPGGDPAQCLKPYPAGTFHGEIVVCDRGEIARVEKGWNVRAGGAGGFVLANTAAEGESIVADAHFLPALHIGYHDAQALEKWLATTGTHTATISGTWTSYNPAYADIMADFSSRGPNANTTNATSVIKPDITAPGVSVIAASMNGIEYESMGGTSMASPHIAGSAALVRALHPNWTPAEVQSALMSTAWTNVLKEDGTTPADPFDRGAGRVDLTQAARAGFVLNENTANYLAADPDSGGDPATLNIASLGSEQCLQSCQWVRTLSSTLAQPVTWTVSAAINPSVTITVTPSTFVLFPGATRAVTIEANVADATNDQWVFGQLNFVPDHLWMMAGTSYTYTATNVDGPEWDRPYSVGDGSSGSCSISSSGPVNYHEQHFEVNADGTYTMTSIQNFDGYLHLYEGSFDPTDQCVDLVALDDDWTMAGDSRIVYTMTSGTNYYLITSGWGDGDEGDFTNTIEGPGNVMLPLGAPAPDAHFPIAIKPSSGILPSLVEINTRRNAGSQLVEDIESLEIFTMTLDTFGLVEGDTTVEMLSQDSTNGDPFDNLNDGVFWITYSVPAGAVRLVANIVESEAPDLDLFVGQDLDGDGPEASEVVCSSTSPSWNEYCDISNPTAGDWWILVQSWAGSTSQPDEVILSSAIVPGSDNGTMTVTGPHSVPKKTPYDLRVYWDTPTMEAGDFWYGAFSIGTDAAHPANIGTIPVNIIRHDDDVSKEVSQSTAAAGDTLVYTITVQPNVTPYTLTYNLTDTIPAGLTYVPGSAWASAGTVTVTGNVLTWTGEMPLSGYSYSFATSDTDPACTAPLATDGAYVDLELYGLNTASGIAGDTFWYAIDFAGGEFDFFGNYQGEYVNFTADGFTFFDPATPGATPDVHQPIPTAGDPNNLMAMFWRDLEVVYDAGTNSGVTLVNLTSAGVPVAAIIEYDNVHDAGDPTTSYDFEWVGYYEPGTGPGGYQYIFAYDNISGTVTAGTIGLENYDGSVGVPVAYNDIAITDGMAICFKQVTAPAPPVVITYEVTIDDGVNGTLENTVEHITDNSGDAVAEASASVTILYKQYLPIVMRDY